MLQIEINYLAILVSGIVIFLICGLWYSPILFAKTWSSVNVKTEEKIKTGSNTYNYVIAFMSGLISAYTLAIFIEFAQATTLLEGVWIAFMCWFGFTGATSFLHYLFSMHPVKLWLIDSAYSFISFVIAGCILAVWK